jgi:hypothetical protein
MRIIRKCLRSYQFPSHSSEVYYRYKKILKTPTNRDSSVGIATGYRLDGWVSILSKGKIFLFTTAFQTGSGAHTASYPIGIGRDFHGGKAAGV